MDSNSIYLQETIRVFRQYKELADKAIAQLDKDEFYFKDFGPRSPSIASIAKHVSGNLLSRWTDFLTTDGEKENRNRDGEFVIQSGETRAVLTAFWEKGWAALLDTLSSLGPADVSRTVTIRGEPHSVPLAIQRSLAHTSYHVGQILYLARLAKEGEWKWLTIPPGASAQFNQAMAGQFPKKPPRTIFHIISRDDWMAAGLAGSVRPSSLETEGFVHCSSADQVAETANLFFSGAHDLLLLEIEEDRLTADIRFEAPSDAKSSNALFPHVYGPINLDAVTAVHTLNPDSRGRFQFPTGSP